MKPGFVRDNPFRSGGSGQQRFGLFELIVGEIVKNLSFALKIKISLLYLRLYEPQEFITTKTV